MATYILGVSALFHDSAAVILRDGEIIAAAQEERFTRIKHDPSFPDHAISFCLTEAGIGPADLAAAAFYEKPLVKLDRLLETYLSYAPVGFASFRRAIPQWTNVKLGLPQLFRDSLGARFDGEVLFTDHHESHAASAFFPSPFDEAAILTLDAVGEWSASSLAFGRGSSIEMIGEMKFPHSLGMLYSAFTHYAGFKVNSGEYKLMGLAPYGEPRFVGDIYDHLIRVHEDGSIWMDMKYFNYCQGTTMTSASFHSLFEGPPRPAESRITSREMDLAASIQVVCEEVVQKAAEYARSSTGQKNLVMAGGVALNCVANGKLRRSRLFDEIWVQPAAGDAGGALGAAMLVWHHYYDKPRRASRPDVQKGSLLGPRYGNDEIGLFLDTLGACYQLFEGEEELLDRVAGLLGSESVVGWFHGRMEFGPRALGARSIIGDARSPSMQKKMNLKIKYRESFRPFAPCVLQGFAHEVFEMEPGDESPYMLFVAPVRVALRLQADEETARAMSDEDLTVRVAVPRSTVPAITHVDYSARVQTVDEERHGRFFRLMEAFHGLSGCPVIVNTSFNIRGEPIVCTPEDAFRCFMATDMDCLVLENHVLLKEEQPEGLVVDAEAYKAQFQLD